MKNWLIKGLVAMPLVVLAPNAMAISIGFSSLTNLNPFTVTSGNNVDVDVVITDRGNDIVTAYDIDIAYDANILTATGVTFGNMLGTSEQSFDLSNPGIIEISEQSLLDEALLDATQPNDFSIATLEFEPIKDGISELELLLFTPGNTVSGANNQVIIGTIPEPTSLALLSVGAIAAFCLRKKKQANHI